MDLTSTSILIVDDEQELSTLYREYLLEMGFDAVSFTNPLMAFEHYRQYADKYSLVITDLRMPGMDGIELANKIRELDYSVKIFLITAFDIADIEGQEFYKSAKIDATLQKPTKLSLLGKIIGQHIEVTVNAKI
jgi:DNA-binding NtrC family response regulator